MDRSAATQRLARIGGRLSAIRSTDGVQVLPVQHPAEIVNYRTMGTAPLVLAGLLAAGAVVALALSLAASVRRRSRELALLKTLGFVRGQLVAAVLIWQALVTVAIGTAVGIPLGVAAGRFLWTRFAGELYVVPQPVISPATVLAVTVVRAGRGHPDRRRAGLAGGQDPDSQRAPGRVGTAPARPRQFRCRLASRPRRRV